MGYLVTHRKIARVTRARRRGLGSTTGSVGTGILTTAATNAPPPTVTQCSADGQYVLVGGGMPGAFWRRLGPGEKCTTLDGGPGVAAGTGGGGVTVTDVTCNVSPPADGLVVDLMNPSNLASGANAPLPLVVSATENTPITYYLSCALNPNLLALNRAQLNWVISAVQYGSVRRSFSDAFTGNDKIDLTTLFPTLSRSLKGQAYKDLYQGKAAVYEFKTPDGDTKNLFLTMGWDQGMNTFTFLWNHQNTVFQAVDNFLTSLSPISTEQLCSMLPIASKVPNPYAQAGSIVLQMSGKCPPTCPTGMLYDANTKTCACPPGSAFNTATQRCEVGGGNTMQKWLVPAVVVGVGAVLIAALNKRKKATP